MFSSISNFGSMIKKMHEIGGKVQELNDRCKQIRITGSAGGGLVLVEVNGLSEVLNCKIDPSVFTQGDSELLEDLIITAVNEAMGEARDKHAEIMRTVAGSMDLPNLDSLKELFGNPDDEKQ